jgi:PAS domain-containing protein
MALTIGEQEIWLAASISPLSEDSVLWVARDITERKQTEIRLKLLERAIASSNNGIVITDATQLMIQIEVQGERSRN